MPIYDRGLYDVRDDYSCDCNNTTVYGLFS